jgi:type II secretory pathway component GspD/PulD (secretin)
VVSQAADMFSQMFTYAIRVPEVSYSLNIFNTQEEFYSVLARPSLVAGLGETSAFFIGRTINVGVSGINLGSVEPIDVGTSVKVTPMEITPERTKFRIDTDRAFLVDQTSGTFEEALTAFKQTVGATVSVEFGKTLVLSGLYEAVNFGDTSKVPGLGDVSGFDILFNDRTKTEKKDTAIILVTPYLPGAIDTGQKEFKGEYLRRLLSLWNRMIDPASNMEAIVDELTWSVPAYFNPQPGDVYAPDATDAETRKLIVDETLLWL